MIAIEHLSVDYFRRGRVIPAVRDFSLAIGPGELVGLVGESGSGKSTLALAVLRLIRAQEGRITSGRILFQGENLLSLPEPRMRAIRGKRISMIFQDPFTALNPVMTIRDQMREVLETHHVPAVLEDALTRVQLDPNRVLASYPHQLSGGQRQRVLIAQALLTRPDLVLADEPTTALDVLVQKEILDLLIRLQKDMGMSMILISHNLGLVAQYAKRMAVMKEGQLVEEGDARKMFRSPEHAYTRELLSALPPMVRRPA